MKRATHASRSMDRQLRDCRERIALLEQEIRDASVAHQEDRHWLPDRRRALAAERGRLERLMQLELMLDTGEEARQ